MQLSVQCKCVGSAPGQRSRSSRRDVAEVVPVNAALAGGSAGRSAAFEQRAAQCAVNELKDKAHQTARSVDTVLGRSTHWAVGQSGTMLSCRKLGVFNAASNAEPGKDNNRSVVRGDRDGSVAFARCPSGLRAARMCGLGLGFYSSEVSGRVADFVWCDARSKRREVRRQGAYLHIVDTYDGGVASEVFVSSPVPDSPPTATPVVKNRNVLSSPAPLPGAQVSHTVTPSSVLPLQSPGLVGIPATKLLVECFEITGGSSLSGHVKISGAKNSALAVLAGALCCKEPLSLRMIPDLHDIRRMFQVLQSTGARVRRVGSSIIVDASRLTSVEPCPEAVRKLRASFFVIGALVGRQGEAVVPLPGGCNIGARPIDLHVRGLEALGAHVQIRYVKHDHLEECSIPLRACRILLHGGFHLIVGLPSK